MHLPFHTLTILIIFIIKFLLSLIWILLTISLLLIIIILPLFLILIGIISLLIFIYLIIVLQLVWFGLNFRWQFVKIILSYVFSVGIGEGSNVILLRIVENIIIIIHTRIYLRSEIFLDLLTILFAFQV
jgi:hypothetical protein